MYFKLKSRQRRLEPRHNKRRRISKRIENFKVNAACVSFFQQRHKKATKREKVLYTVNSQVAYCVLFSFGISYSFDIRIAANNRCLTLILRHLVKCVEKAFWKRKKLYTFHFFSILYGACCRNAQKKKQSFNELVKSHTPNRQIMLQMIRKVPLHVLKTYSLKWRKTCFARKIKWKPFSIFEWLDNTRQLVIMSKNAYNFMRKFLAHTNHRLYFVKRKKNTPKPHKKTRFVGVHIIEKVRHTLTCWQSSIIRWTAHRNSVQFT